ncbi:hypothetical protein Misp06_01085 [Microbulbifer sp. NBRC 101763]|uniref:hypothetical protein n=1 Tax=Microbulbifer sp. NBRC 101763 TaxID=1113820 RepID=UPI0030ADDC28
MLDFPIGSARRPFGAVINLFLFLLLSFVSPLALADDIVERGFYQSEQAAQNACVSDMQNDNANGCNSCGGCGYWGYYVGQTGYYYRFSTSGNGCPSDKAPNDDGMCVDPETLCDSDDLPTGAEWNSQAEACICPEGTSAIMHPDLGYQCLADVPECTANSPGFRGYADDTAVCDMNEFCPEGQSGGLVNGNWTCIADSSCAAGETYINGACIGPDNLTSDPTTDFDETDTDGDGIPDSNDDDIDGDGTPNGQDDDIDGDGIPNDDDPTQEGDKDKEGSANASGGCTVAPQCTGDPQECAILKQQWYTMCHSDFESPDEQEFTSAAQDRYEQAQADWDETMQTIYSEVSNKLDFNLSSGSGSLPNDVRSVFGQNINFSISQFGSQLGNVGNLIYFACTLLAAGILLRR